MIATIELEARRLYVVDVDELISQFPDEWANHWNGDGPAPGSVQAEFVRDVYDSVGHEWDPDEDDEEVFILLREGELAE